MKFRMNRDIAEVFVLNLNRRQDRLQAFRLRSEAAGLVGALEPRRIEAVDGRNFPVFRGGVSPAESATTMSHRYIWGLALACGGPVLILEDDAEFCQDFTHRLAVEIDLPENCDVLQLGMSWLKLRPGDGPVRIPEKGWGLFAYVLFPYAAEKLLRGEAAAPLGVADAYSAPGKKLNINIIYPMWARGLGNDSDIAVRPSSAVRYQGLFEGEGV